MLTIKNNLLYFILHTQNAYLTKSRSSVKSDSRMATIFSPVFSAESSMLVTACDEEPLTLSIAFGTHLFFHFRLIRITLSFLHLAFFLFYTTFSFSSFALLSFSNLALLSLFTFPLTRLRLDLILFLWITSSSLKLLVPGELSSSKLELELSLDDLAAYFPFSGRRTSSSPLLELELGSYIHHFFALF